MTTKGIKRSDTIATDAIVRVLAPLPQITQIKVIRAVCALLGLPVTSL